jgi:hypothetical protein
MFMHCGFWTFLTPTGLTDGDFKFVLRCLSVRLSVLTAQYLCGWNVHPVVLLATEKKNSQ